MTWNSPSVCSATTYGVTSWDRRFLYNIAGIEVHAWDTCPPSLPSLHMTALHPTINVNTDSLLSPATGCIASLRQHLNECQGRNCVQADLKLCESSFAFVKSKSSITFKLSSLFKTPLNITTCTPEVEGRELRWQLANWSTPGNQSISQFFSGKCLISQYRCVFTLADDERDTSVIQRRQHWTCLLSRPVLEWVSSEQWRQWFTDRHHCRGHLSTHVDRC